MLTMLRKFLMFLMIAVFALPIMAGKAGAAQVLITQLGQFDYPGTAVSTEPRGINNHGTIVGRVIFPDGSIAGFVRFKNGSFAKLINPAGDGTDTEAAGITDGGVIVGLYKQAFTGVVLGFTLQNKTYTDFEGAPATCNSQPCTAVLDGIDDGGDVVGGWFPPNAPEQAFAFFANRNPMFVPITSSRIASSIAASATAISSNGLHVVGGYTDAKLLSQSFYWNSTAQQVKLINYPGAVQTSLFGVNNVGYMIGRYVDVAGVSHGIVHAPPKLAGGSGLWAAYDFPGATLTSLERINNLGVATGRWTDSAGLNHGFTVQISFVP
jgi:uncharacterized membrane protein